MTYSDQDADNDITNEQLYERDGRGFKLKKYDPYGHWRVFYAANNIPVPGCPGEYTSLKGAQQAIDAIPEDKLPQKRTNKVVLTPRVKQEEQD